MTDVQHHVHDPIARAVIHSAADAIVAVDQTHQVTVWNPAAERMFGWTAEEMVGRVPPIVPDELKAEHNAVQERLLTRRGDDGDGESGQISFATRRFHRDGRLIDVRIDTSLLKDPSGTPLGWVGVYHPVDENEIVQHHMTERARLVRRLNDIVADLNAELDLAVVLDRITEALIELTGADAGGFVRIEGDRLRLVSMSGLPERMRGTSADLRSSLVGELLRSGKTVKLATGERRLGDLIWSELPGLHTIALGLSYLQNRPYGALYALFSGRKIGHTELELLELLAGHAGVAVGNAVAYAEVVRQRAHERAVIDSSADGIAVLDNNLVVRQWNPAAHSLTGIAPEHALGRPLPFDMPALGEMLTFRLESGRWLNVLAAEIEETGELVVDFRDVSEAKALEEAKDLFLATTSHELRTPITVVQGFASTLVNRWDEMADGDRRAAVATIAERAQSLGRLVEHLLLGSRAGADELTVTIEPFDLTRVLEGVVAGFRSLSPLHRVELEIEPGLPPCRGDAMATDIILGQLLENAFKYSPDGGTVFVRAVREGTGIVVTVTDEGIGIPDGDHERIFERFVQGETGDRRRFGGIGLGLYIVKRLTEEQGGTISAHPAEIGKSDGSHIESPRPDETRRIGSAGGRPNVLLREAEKHGRAGGADIRRGTCMRLVLRAAP
ncbi:PAS domain S-box-containing protein [Actinomadura pelletieri DSM 43383]|uniref:Sensor-like histidine kinase SenX3 n=1 Tax=Actinomadura pelletieri DSM 43383 TaxID=1120940 RepID=A0A495QZE2_9ACTN|nr:PAS domain-containing protein [Actinomadura pelletieri]RKS79408.1 PAS domain S-box-containing protein [Actinomadura pelletieri DSM 43383]